MNIFRGKKKDRRGRRTDKQRHESRRRRTAPAGLLDDLAIEETTAVAPVTTRRKTKRQSSREAAVAGISLVHVAFLLTGLALGAGILLSVNAVLKWRAASLQRAAHEAQAKAEVAPPKPAPARAATPPRVPQVYQSSSPVETVRVMLKASLAGDRPTAYGQWDIAPNEMATIRQGQVVTLSETTDAAAAVGGSINLSDYQFELQSQADDQATVLQKRDGTVIQKYLLRRHGAYWKIRFASSP